LKNSSIAAITNILRMLHFLYGDVTDSTGVVRA